MENEGQDSLNTSAPSANSSAQPTGAVDPIAPRRIVSSPDLTPPTAISAPLPTDPLHPIQTVGTGEGDLVIGEKSFDKKWLIIGATIVAAGVLVVLIIMGISAITKGAPANTRQKAKDAFLEYSNYALNGKASAEKLDTACVQKNSCYFTQAAQDKSKLDAFFTDSVVLRKKLDEAVISWSDADVHGNTDGTPAEITAQIIQKIRDLVDANEFVEVYSNRGMLKKNDIVNHYLNNGEADIESYIKNYYGSDYSDNAYLASLRDDASVMSEAVLANIRLYAKYGCMDGFMNEACFATHAAAEEKATAAKNRQFIADYGMEISAYSSMPQSIIDDIVKINDLFNLQEQTE